MEATPDPTCQRLAGGILKALDFVQVVVVQSAANRLTGLRDVGEIHHPPELGIRLAGDEDPDSVRVTMQTFALVTIREVRKQMRGFEPELSPNLHWGPMWAVGLADATKNPRARLHPEIANQCGASLGGTPLGGLS